MRPFVALFLTLFGGVFFLHAGCGGGATVEQCPGGPDCACTDDKTCSCAADGGCGFACAQDNCVLTCGDGATCEGSCEKDCDMDCKAGSSCTIDLGQSGDIACVDADCVITAQDETDVSCDGGTCKIECLARCDLSCVGGATCEAKCPGDADFAPFEGSKQCQ